MAAKNLAKKKPKPAKKPAAKKAAPKKTVPKKVAPKKVAPKKVAFGRAGTAGKAEGDGAVKIWLGAVKPEHRPIVKKLDALIGKTVPDVKRAIKWSTPLYGREGKGYFASMASFKDYVSLGFFKGASLDPPPPFGEGKDMRRINIESMDQVDEKLFRRWIEQASSKPGWGKV